MTEAFMPGIKNINGHTYVKIQDLADQWHTTTSHILNTGKPNQVPEKYRRTIDGHTWCDVEGLRYRLSAMKRGGRIPVQLNQLLDRFPIEKNHVDDGVGPQRETIHMEDGATCVLTRSYLRRIDYPSQEEIKGALDNKQVIWRWKNRVQVLAQTLSSFLDTRTSSLLAVNKKQGVPGKYIHRQWKRTWVDLEGLKQRVNHTEHESALLKHLKQVIENLDAYEDAYTRPLIVEESQQSASASASKPSASAKSCDLAVEANKRAVHNTERLNKLTRDEAALENLIFKYRDACSIDLGTQSKRLDMLADRLHRIEAGDKQAVQAMAEGKTPLDALSQRVSGLVTHVDRLDGKTDGLESRVSVLEDTSKWLSWSLATLVSLRSVGLMLRLLKRK